LQNKTDITTVGDLVCRGCYNEICLITDLIKEENDLNNNVKMETDENIRSAKLVAIERIQENILFESKGNIL
jgi:hypothetical protein